MSITNQATSTPPSSLYSSSQLHLPPSSPLFTYSPSIALPSSDANSAGWTGWYPVSDSSGIWFGWYSATTPNLNDESGGGWVTLTILNADSFAINFDLPSTANEEGWTIQAQVDSETPVVVTSGTMVRTSDSGDDGTHSLRFRATCTGDTGEGCGSPGDPFRFTGVDVGVAVVSGSTISSASLDDASSLISYQGYTSSSSTSSDTFVTEDLIKRSMDETLSYTATKGATASLTFTGTSIVIIGTVGPSLSTYTASIYSSSLTTTYNASLPLSLPGQVIAFFSGLEDTDHVLIVENDVDDGGLVLDGFWCWSGNKARFGSGPQQPAPESMTLLPGSTPTSTTAPNGFITSKSTAIAIGTSGPSVGTIIGVVVAILGAIAIGIICLVYFRPKKESTKKKKFNNPADEANALPNQRNQFVEVRPMLTTSAYVKGPDGEVRKDVPWDQQGYSYPGANFGKAGGPPHSAFRGENDF